MFQLTAEEKAEVAAKCDHLKQLRFSHVFPYAFTEHGAIMLASVLNSPIAVQTSVQRCTNQCSGRQGVRQAEANARF